MKKLKFFKGAKKEKAELSIKDLKIFNAEIDVLNFAPPRYFYTDEWAVLVTDAVKTFRDIISKAKPDELNPGMMDAYIDSQYNAMRAYVDDQRVEHEATLMHNQMLLNGELLKLNEQVRLLDTDLADNADAKAALSANAI